ncbi:hypothetical protein HMPREF1148_2204 [Selenomonas sp. FOBRC6]|nr:hypothetical protein HMPREF1148_2204 [Selenomonas sp. FOBRC6]
MRCDNAHLCPSHSIAPYSIYILSLNDSHYTGKRLEMR